MKPHVDVSQITKTIDAWGYASKRFIKRHDLALAVCIAIIVICFGSWLGWRNNKIIPGYPFPHFRYNSTDPLRFLANWDGPDYITIAKHGYQRIFDASFFPLYPLLIRLVHYVLPSYLLSALLISWGSFIGVLYFYAKILRHLGIVKTTTNLFYALLLLVLFPTGVFFIATYTESLFAFLALASIYAALKHRPLLCGVLLFFAAITHITGLPLIILDALILWEERLPIVQIASVAGAGVVSIAAYMAYMYSAFRDPLAFVTSQKKIHSWLGHNYYEMLKTTDALNIVFSLLLIASAWYYWNRRRSFSVYSILFLLIPAVGAQWGGFNRYVLAAFPIPIMLYEILKNRRQAYTAVLIVFSILWTLTLLQYAAGYIGS